MYSAEKFLSEEPLALRRGEHSDINVNEPSERRHCAQMMGVKEESLLEAVEFAGLSTRAVHKRLGC